MKTKKIMATVLAGTLTASLAVGAVGCKSSKDALQISVVNVGYGVEWLHKLAEGYNSHNPDVEIDIDDSYYGGIDKQFVDQVLSGETDTDIYFSRDAMFEYMQRGQSAGGEYYDRILEDLTDLYEAENPYDNDRTMKSKIHPDVLRDISMKQEDGKEHQFSVPWVMDALGIMYNADLFEEYNLTVPNTTHELITLCEHIQTVDCAGTEAQNGKLTPFVDSYSDSYWNILTEGWITQYEGVEAMQGEYGFWNGYDPNGDRYYSTVLSYDGIERAYEVLHDLMCETNGYVHKKSKDLTFTAAQNYIIDKDYGVCMMPNGAWIQREMEQYEADDVHLGMMKMPIISSIVEKLSIWNEAKGTTFYTLSDEKKAEYDEKLSVAVKAVDEGKTECEGFTADDMAKIAEARGLLFSWTAGHVGYIPVYSDKKDTARDFLQYMVSDEGLRIFTQATNGCTQPYDFDYLGDETTSAAMNDFMKSIYGIVEESQLFLFEKAKDPLYCFGGVTLSYNWSGITMLQAFTANPNKPYNSADPVSGENYMTAKQFATYRMNLYEGQWTTVTAAAGVTAGGSQ